MNYRGEEVYFYFSTAEKKLRYGDERQIRKGRTHEVTCEPILCEQGLHASKRSFDALTYAPGPYLWLVTLSGTVVHGGDKSVATERTYVKGFNAEKLLREFARKQALINVEKIKPYTDAESYALIVKYLETGEERLRSAAESAASAARSAASAARSTAWSAAESAAWAAESAAWAAESAAESAAWATRSAAWATRSAAWVAWSAASAARSTAWSAAESAAWAAESAAKGAAESAAESAAWATRSAAWVAWSAARVAWSAAKSAAEGAANKMLEEMILGELNK